MHKDLTNNEITENYIGAQGTDETIEKRKILRVRQI